MAIDIEVRTAVIQAQGLIGVQSALRDVRLILRQDGNVILPGRLLAERHAFDTVPLRYLSVELHPHKAHLREFQTVLDNGDIAFNPVGSVRLAGRFLTAEFRETDGLVPEEIPVGSLHLYLGIAIRP